MQFVRILEPRLVLWKASRKKVLLSSFSLAWPKCDATSASTGCQEFKKEKRKKERKNRQTDRQKGTDVDRKKERWKKEKKKSKCPTNVPFTLPLSSSWNLNTDLNILAFYGFLFGFLSFHLFFQLCVWLLTLQDAFNFHFCQIKCTKHSPWYWLHNPTESCSQCLV